MGYREMNRVDMVELVRRWQAGESVRAIARQTRVARATVSKYLVAAQALGMHRASGLPTEEQRRAASNAALCHNL